ncbi:hypothetical protein UlMin_025192 [Ulmus minor]
MWTRDLRSHAVVRHAWSSTHLPHPPDQFLARVKHTKRALSIWNKCQFGKLQMEIAYVRTTLAACQNGIMNENNKERDKSLRRQLEELLKREELLWFQKSSVRWVLEGDRCTKFFFISTLVRRRHNKIEKIRLDNGVWLTSREDIRWPFKINSMRCMDNKNLLLIPDSTEIKNVVFTMGDYKAPGPDGLPAVFFKTYWSTVGRDVICMVRHFFLSGFLH